MLQSMMYDAFIVTKPLQYINVLNILNDSKKILILINSFNNAEKIFNYIKDKSDYWEMCVLFDNINDVYIWLTNNKHSINTLYLDSDVKGFALHEYRNMNITVYEEGIGTYRRSLRSNKDKKFIYFLKKQLGFYDRIGGNRFTKNIIIYFPKFYETHIGKSKKKLISFKLPFIEHLKTCKETSYFNNKFNYSSFKNKTVTVYISDWDISKITNQINNFNCDINILKPHPHIKDLVNIKEFDIVLSPEIIIEIFISNILEYAKKIYLVSFYSTSTLYFNNIENIEVVNLDLMSEGGKAYSETYNKLVQFIMKQK